MLAASHVLNRGQDGAVVCGWPSTSTAFSVYCPEFIIYIAQCLYWCKIACAFYKSVILWSIYRSKTFMVGRRQGGGVICRPRAHLALSSTFNSRRTLFDLSRECAVYDIRGSADYFYRWLLPIQRLGLPLHCRHPVRIHRRGCAPENLRSVSWAPRFGAWSAWL